MQKKAVPSRGVKTWASPVTIPPARAPRPALCPGPRSKEPDSAGLVGLRFLNLLK